MYITDSLTGADPGLFLGGGALFSCSTSTAINHIVFFFFLQNTSCIRKPQVISGGGGVRTPCTLPLDPPLSKLHVNLRKYDTLIFVSVHGGLGQWGDWSGCDKTCGLGKRTRERPCDNPKPQYGGRPCNDSGRREFRYCREQRCPIGLLCFKTLFR